MCENPERDTRPTKGAVCIRLSNPMSPAVLFAPSAKVCTSKGEIHATRDWREEMTIS